MLEGWLKVGMRPQGVTVLDPRPSDEMTRFCRERGIALNPGQAPAAPEVLVLAIKPQMLDEAAPALNGCLGPQTAHHLDPRRQDHRRPAEHGFRPPARSCAPCRTCPPASAAAPRAPPPTTQVSEDAAPAWPTRCSRSNGIVEWLPSEDLIDAVTALSGSGPGLCVPSRRVPCRGGRRGRASRRSRAAPRARHGDGRGRTAVPERPAARDPAPERDLARRHDRRSARSPHGAIRTG